MNERSRTEQQKFREQRGTTEHLSLVEHEIKVMLALTEDILQQEFKKLGKRYRPVKVVFYDSETKSLGAHEKNLGPHYNSIRSTLYINPGDLVETAKPIPLGDLRTLIAHVIFHEVSHHVQNLLGMGFPYITNRHGIPPKIVNVAFELHADCMAAMLLRVGHEKYGLLTPTTISTLYASYAAAGDSQEEHPGGRNATTLTHGTSAMRKDMALFGLRMQSLDEVPDIPTIVKYIYQETRTTPADWVKHQDS